VVIVVDRHQLVGIEESGRRHPIEDLNRFLPDEEPITHEVPLGLKFLDHLRRLLEFDHNVSGIDALLEKGECRSGYLTFAAHRSGAALNRALPGEGIDLGRVEHVNAIVPALRMKDHPLPAPNRRNAHAKRGRSG